MQRWDSRAVLIPGLVILVAALVLLRPAAAQSSAEGWEAHTSFRSVLALASGGDELWAATEGGVFGYTLSSGEIRRFSVIDGLASVETRTLATDADRGLVWVGYADGVLDRLDTSSGIITSFRDIERAEQFASRGINRIVVRGDSLLIATDFGVVVFDPERTEVRDSYTRLGSFSPAIVANDVLVAADAGGALRIWVATDEGLAHAPMFGGNLQDPAQWSNESAGFMGSGDDALSLASFESSIYVGTTLDLFRRTGAGAYERKFVSSSGVYSMTSANGRLFGTERFNLFMVDTGGQAVSVGLPGFQDPTGIVPTSATSAWVGDAAGGLLSVSLDFSAGQATIAETVTPEGPIESSFSEMEVGSDGTLWAAGAAEAGGGFHRLAPDGRWTAYSRNTEAALSGTGFFTRIAVDGQGNGWAGSEGNGVVQVSPEGEVTRFTPANASLQPAPGTLDFVITSGVEVDSDDNLWVTTRATPQPLHVRQADGSWFGYDPYVGDGLTLRSTAYGKVYVDSFGQKWIIIRNENRLTDFRGLIVLETGSTPTVQSDDSFRFFDQAGAAGLGLPSPKVFAVEEDRDGLVWVGTESGLAYFINTGIVARDPSARAIWPQWADRSRGTFVLFGLKINDLAVDPANRLWVATSEGAWLIESVEGGYDLVQQFSEDNSPLFSDEVLSIAIDSETGRVYFATDQGLLSYQGDAIAPVTSAGDLFVYPNPVRGDEEVIIEGLVESAQVRIVTPGGSTVAAFASRGGRIRWDGKDRNGKRVPSGVYLVVAVGDDGQGTSYGKVAVIR
ncbi:MAG: regulator [Rhodothermales bacterium]|nr:regulator [Rhodothermales bacterium]